MNFDEIESRVRNLADKIVSEMDQVSAEALGLDRRCGIVFADFENRVIAVPEYNLRLLMYYGGFEYIEDEFKTVVGEYTFFCDENDRVECCFDFYENNSETEE